MENLEKIFRNFGVSKLVLLSVIAKSGSAVISNTEIKKRFPFILGREQFGGMLSSLARTKINNQPLLIPVGLSILEGKLWRINEKAAQVDRVKELTGLILGENLDYRTTALKELEADKKRKNPLSNLLRTFYSYIIHR